MKPQRQCGACTLCCKLLPVRELAKAANERCRHQRIGRGCAVYRTGAMPPACAIWNCRWLVNDDADDLSRPDRAHYVIDIMPDFVTTVDNATGETLRRPVVQIWCDPNHRDAHRDPHLRAWLERRAADGVVGLVRFGNGEGLVLVPPALNADDKTQWLEITSAMREDQHSFEEIARAWAQA